MRNKFYVYIPKSINNPSKSYIGFSKNIEKRFTEHNSKTQKYTKNYAPWKLETYFVFSDQKKALVFERYLKSGSGKAFINTHL
ncbi:MAG: GIY-YIG nuclease family protein [Candidatus Saganbacteria bacterium]|nr:GIY-YIG nuclease family protein [Candidatus Saganbacteria bacterium]